MKHGAILILGVAALVAGLATDGPARPKRSADELKIKAVCLYNFLKFVEWPDAQSPTNPDAMVIGIVGERSFGENFSAVEGSMIPGKNRELVVRRLGPYRPGLSLAGCHLVFMTRSEQNNFARIVDEVAGMPVLTVGDGARFLERGGMIELSLERQRVRWHVNMGPVRTAGLKLDSQLLRAAVDVVSGPE